MKPGTARSLEIHDRSHRRLLQRNTPRISSFAHRKEQTVRGEPLEGTDGRLHDAFQVRHSPNWITCRIYNHGLRTRLNLSKASPCTTSLTTLILSILRDAPPTVLSSNPHPRSGVQPRLRRIHQSSSASSRGCGVSWIRPATSSSPPERSATWCGPGAVALVFGGGYG